MSTRVLQRLERLIEGLRSETRRDQASLIRSMDKLEARVAKLEDHTDPDGAKVRGLRKAQIPRRPAIMRELGIGQDPA